MKNLLIILVCLLGGTSCLLAQQPDSLTYLVDTIPGTNVIFRLVYIPAGEFVMGSPESEPHRDEDEGPQRKVQVDAFWMGVFEVTYDEYEIFREKDRDANISKTNPDYQVDAVTRPSPPYEDPTFGMGKYGYPAASMTQYAALMYCRWLSGKTGRFYRLPTEAEWEYACRAGSTSAYHFGDDPAQLDQYAWYYDNSDDGYHKVGTKKPNAWGLYDMHGNVAEWTLDQYRPDFLASLGDSTAINPWTRPTDLHPRTVRGGSYDDDPEELRAANRIESSMNWKRRDPQIPKSFWWNTDSPFVGFRIISPAKEMTAEEIFEFWMTVLDG